jgi:hypothetical protein
MSAAGSIEWSESGSVAEIQGMIEDWNAEGKRGATLLIAVQEMISEEFPTTLSPRSCNNLRRFLTQYDVPVDTVVGYPKYRDILDLIRRNPTLAGTPSAPVLARTEDFATSTVTATVHHAPNVLTVPGHADHSSPFIPVHTPAGDDLSNWASVPALRSGPDSSTITAPRGQALNRSASPSRSIVDLIKAYSTEKGKFSGENPEQSLRTVRRSFFSTCKLMHVSPEDALRAAHLPFIAMLSTTTTNLLKAILWGLRKCSTCCRLAFRPERFKSKLCRKADHNVHPYHPVSSDLNVTCPCGLDTCCQLDRLRESVHAYIVATSG